MNLSRPVEASKAGPLLGMSHALGLGCLRFLFLALARAKLWASAQNDAGELRIEVPPHAKKIPVPPPGLVSVFLFFFLFVSCVVFSRFDFRFPFLFVVPCSLKLSFYFFVRFVYFGSGPGGFALVWFGPVQLGPV